jgi:putative oxygen-independent coproporphyrinogen III oxidase
MSNPIGIYFHWPFCLAKCPYCDFNVHIQQNIDHAAWEAAYLKAIRYYAPLTKGREVVSVFFGGGTPSLMEPTTIQNILFEIRNHWSVAKDVEITLEANPTSVEIGKFEKFRKAGVNRVSLGVQSLKDEYLKFLGRKHDSQQALAAIDTAKGLFERFSFDLIYARPNQTLEQWKEELEFALSLGADHMSLYQLTIERSTPFYLDREQGKFTMPDDVAGAEFYNLTQDVMGRAGLPAYEVSNHAKAGQESRHNLIYWNYGDYIGIGPGAHGRLTLNGVKNATREHSAPDIWMGRVTADEHGHHPFETVSPREKFIEALMMGLRLRDGVPIARLEAEGEAAFDELIHQGALEQLAGEGWVTLDPKTLKLTREGMLRLNAIVPFILR